MLHDERQQGLRIIPFPLRCRVRSSTGTDESSPRARMQLSCAVVAHFCLERCEGALKGISPTDSGWTDGPLDDYYSIPQIKPGNEHKCIVLLAAERSSQCSLMSFFPSWWSSVLWCRCSLICSDIMTLTWFPVAQCGDVTSRAGRSGAQSINVSITNLLFCLSFMSIWHSEPPLAVTGSQVLTYEVMKDGIFWQMF